LPGLNGGGAAALWADPDAMFTLLFVGSQALVWMHRVQHNRLMTTVIIIQSILTFPLVGGSSLSGVRPSGIHCLSNCVNRL